MEVEIDADPNASAGLLVFYSRKLYAGLGFSQQNMRLHLYGMDRTSAKPKHLGQRMWVRLRNDRHIVTLDYSADGKTWERYDRGIEVSGYHHNVAYDFLSLRPALYASGNGEVRFRNFKYRALAVTLSRSRHLTGHSSRSADHRIDARGAAGGNESGEHGHRRQGTAPPRCAIDSGSVGVTSYSSAAIKRPMPARRRGPPPTPAPMIHRPA